MTFSQHYPASTVASDIMAYVCDDPKLYSVCRVTKLLLKLGLATTSLRLAQRVQPRLVEARTPLDGGSIATTNSLPLRVVDFVDGPTSAVGDAFTDCIVTYLPLSHAYETKLGV